MMQSAATEIDAGRRCKRLTVNHGRRMAGIGRKADVQDGNRATRGGPRAATSKCASFELTAQ